MRTDRKNASSLSPPIASRATRVLLSGVTMFGLAGCQGEPGGFDGVESHESAVMCGTTDERTKVTTLTSPNGAVGRLVLDGSFNCSGTVIGSNKVLTAAHCIDNIAPSRLKF